eukprot:COSAG02_NODE_5697_length_4115_cov_4.386205_2_plen_45_part_00
MWSPRQRAAKTFARQLQQQQQRRRRPDAKILILFRHHFEKAQMH